MMEIIKTMRYAAYILRTEGSDKDGTLPDDLEHDANAVDALLAALQSIEWVDPPWPAIGHEPFCPWCGNYKSDGHRDDCGRQTAMARVGEGEK